MFLADSLRSCNGKKHWLWSNLQQTNASCNIEFLRPGNADHWRNIWSLYQRHEDSSCSGPLSCSQQLSPLRIWLAHLPDRGLFVSNVSPVILALHGSLNSQKQYWLIPIRIWQDSILIHQSSMLVCWSGSNGLHYILSSQFKRLIKEQVGKTQPNVTKTN